jgi:hypothetical protein
MTNDNTAGDADRARALMTKFGFAMRVTHDGDNRKAAR